MDSLSVHTLLSIYGQLNATEQSLAIAHNAALHQLMSSHYLVGQIHRINTMSVWLNDDDGHSNDTIINDSGSVFDNQLHSTFGTFSKIFTHLQIFITASAMSERSMAFLREVNANCTDSLEHIAISGATGRVFDEWKLSPFAAVTAVTLRNSTLPPDLNAMFPQMRRLDIDSSQPHLNFAVFGRNFPHLTHFKLTVGDVGAINETAHTHLDQLISLNPQMRSLHIPFAGRAEALTRSLGTLAHLESLGLEGRWVGGGNETGADDAAHLKNLTRFWWVGRDTDNTDDMATIPLIRFERLQVLEVSLGSNQLTDTGVEQMTSKYPDLERLTMKRCRLTPNQLTLIAHTLAKLKTLQIEWHDALENGGIGAILTQHGHLKRVILVTAADVINVENVLGEFAPRWKCEREQIIGFRRFSHFIRS